MSAFLSPLIHHWTGSILSGGIPIANGLRLSVCLPVCFSFSAVAVGLIGWSWRVWVSFSLVQTFQPTSARTPTEGGESVQSSDRWSGNPSLSFDQTHPLLVLCLAITMASLQFDASDVRSANTILPFSLSFLPFQTNKGEGPTTKPEAESPKHLDSCREGPLKDAPRRSEESSGKPSKRLGKGQRGPPIRRG